MKYLFVLAFVAAAVAAPVMSTALWLLGNRANPGK